MNLSGEFDKGQGRCIVIPQDGLQDHMSENIIESLVGILPVWSGVSVPVLWQDADEVLLWIVLPFWRCLSKGFVDGGG